MDSAEAISKLREVVSTHPDLFPNLANFGNRDGLYHRTNLSSLIPEAVWKELQLGWIRTSSDENFLVTFSSNTMNRLSEPVNEAISQKLLDILRHKLIDHPNVFPTPAGVVNLELPNLTSTLSIRVPRSAWDKLQLEWIATSTDEHFLAAISNIKKTSDNVTTAINKRVLDITKKRLASNPEVFPNPFSLQKLCNLTTRHILSSRIPKATMEELQLEWIRTSSDKNFLAALSSGNLSVASKQINIAIDARLLEIFKKTSTSHPELFPTYAGLSSIGNLPETVTLTRRIPKAVLGQMQLEWIKTSTQEHFVAEFSNNKMTALSKKLNDAINKRLREILVSSLTSCSPLPLPLKTFQLRVADFHDVMAIFGFLYGIRSLDQQIVSKIGLRESQREPWVNILMNERLEQLWFFRELVVLARTGNADNSTVVSFSNDSLPARLQALVPSVSVSHMQLENLEAGPVILTDRTVLLSVAQWLSPERSANLFRNLALSSSVGHTVLFTYPFDHQIMPDAVDNLARLGFELVKLGELRLTPVLGIQEKRKLDQISRVGMLERTSIEPDPSLSKLDLFLRPTRVSRVTYADVDHASRTYRLVDLVSSTPSLVFYPVNATTTSTTVPSLTSIHYTGDSAAFVLVFSGDSVAGFHMDPLHAHTVEIEGPTVTKGVIDATVAIIEGRQPKISVAGPELRADYSEFLAHLRSQNPQRVGPVLKRRIR